MALMGQPSVAIVCPNCRNVVWVKPDVESAVRDWEKFNRDFYEKGLRDVYARIAVMEKRIAEMLSDQAPDPEQIWDWDALVGIWAIGRKVYLDGDEVTRVTGERKWCWRDTSFFSYEFRVICAGSIAKNCLRIV